jgi:hypothetical protein
VRLLLLPGVSLSAVRLLVSALGTHSLLALEVSLLVAQLLAFLQGAHSLLALAHTLSPEARQGFLAASELSRKADRLRLLAGQQAFVHL